VASNQATPPLFLATIFLGNRRLTLSTTEGSIATGRMFDADVVIYTSDHAAGRLTAVALAVPALEVGNRVSWSMRDEQFLAEQDITGTDEITRHLRAKLGIGDGDPELVARIVPRAPSMGGLSADEPDQRDAVPWWPMRFVPYNGGAVVPDWALHRPSRPRLCVTLHRRADHDRHPHPVRCHVRARPTAGQCASAQRVVERGVGLSLDQTTIDGTDAAARASVEQLLDEPTFAAAAREVSAEMATNPAHRRDRSAYHSLARRTLAWTPPGGSHRVRSGRGGS
jgi:hypothetical protein